MLRGGLEKKSPPSIVPNLFHLLYILPSEACTTVKKTHVRPEY